MAHSLPRSPRPGGVDYNSRCNIDQDMFTTIYKWLDKTKTGARGLANPNDEENKKNLRAAVEKLYRYIKGGQAGLRRLSAARRKALVEVVDILELSTRDMNPAYSRGLHDNLVQATDYLATLVAQPDDGNPPTLKLELDPVDRHDWDLGYDPPPYDGPIYSQPAIKDTERDIASPELRRRSGIPVRIANRSPSPSFITPEHSRQQQSERYSHSPRTSITKMQRTFDSNIPRYVGPGKSFNQTSLGTPQTDPGTHDNASPFLIRRRAPPPDDVRPSRGGRGGNSPTNGQYTLPRDGHRSYSPTGEDGTPPGRRHLRPVRVTLFNSSDTESPSSPANPPNQNHPTDELPPFSAFSAGVRGASSPTGSREDRASSTLSDFSIDNRDLPDSPTGGQYTPGRGAQGGYSPTEGDRTPPGRRYLRPVRVTLFNSSDTESPSTPGNPLHRNNQSPTEVLPQASPFASGVRGTSSPPGLRHDVNPASGRFSSTLSDFSIDNRDLPESPTDRQYLSNSGAHGGYSPTEGQYTSNRGAHGGYSPTEAQYTPRTPPRGAHGGYSSTGGDRTPPGRRYLRPVRTTLFNSPASPGNPPQQNNQSLTEELPQASAFASGVRGRSSPPELRHDVSPSSDNARNYSIEYSSFENISNVSSSELHPARRSHDDPIDLLDLSSIDSQDDESLIRHRMFK